MKDKTVTEQLPYIDGVVVCGDQRQIKWLNSRELLNGAEEPNSNKGTVNRVPLMLYKNIIFIAEVLDENGSIIKDHTKQIEKLFEEFEYFGGEEFAEKIEQIIEEQELLGETNLEILIQLEEFEESLDQHDEVIGMDMDFEEREGSILTNLGYIASIIGNKEGKDFYGNEVEDNPSSGVYDTMTTVIKTVNGLRTQVTEFDNTLNNVELQVSGQVLEIEGIKAVVGNKAKVIINDVEVELVHDDAIEQLFERVKNIGSIVAESNEKVIVHETRIDGIDQELETFKLEHQTQNKEIQEHIKESDKRMENVETRLNSLEEEISKVDDISGDLSTTKLLVEENRTSISSMGSDIGLLQTTVSSLEDKTNSMARNISNNEESIESLSSDIKETTKNLTETKLAIEENKNDIIVINNAISELTTKEETKILEDGLAKNSEDISELKLELVSKGGEITELKDANQLLLRQLTEFGNRVDALEASKDEA